MLSINFGKETETLCDEYCNGFTDVNGQYIEGMVVWIQNRITNKFSNYFNLKSNKKNKEKLIEVKSKLTKDNILMILKGNSKELLELWENEFKIYKDLDFSYSYKIKKTNKIRTVKALYHIFNYDSFRDCKNEKQFGGFLLSKKLGIECCPYCNRIYTTSNIVYQDKTVFPEFDHFYHKSEFPLLAISFYNIIPSCNVCNTHFKGAKNSIKYNIFHPYTQLKSNHFNFKNFPNDVASLYGAKDNISLEFDYNSSNEENIKLKNSIDFFGIKDIYEKSHSSLIKEIIHKRIAFSERYMKELQDTYKMSFEDSYKIVFETHFEEENLHKRPFSKLKKDIYNSLK